jgi:hypothetical protein
MSNRAAKVVLTIGVAAVLTVAAFVVLVLTGFTTGSTGGDLLVLAAIVAGAIAIAYGLARLVGL